MQSLHLIVVGKLKDSRIETLEVDYLKRITSFKLQIHEVKAHSENLEIEADEVLKKANELSRNPYLILMTETGKERNSLQFSDWLFNQMQKNNDLIFVIGGAAGHGKKVMDASREKISLGQLTFPHKLARLLFVEQLYRAQTIQSGHPYHK